MTKFFSVLLAVAAVVITGSSAQAQSYSSGYQFGAGIQSAGFGQCGIGNNGFYRSFQRDQQIPYFAQFPPVYYSHVVPRPYGISPYAAPPGIVPVEMTVPNALPNPTVIKNPYFDRSVKTEVPPKSVPQVEGKTTSNTPVWTTNPNVPNHEQELSLMIDQ